MTDNKLENEENVPECVEIKLAYDLAAIPFLGVLFYAILYFFIVSKLGTETFYNSSWFKKIHRRLWIHTGRPLVILFFIGLTLLFIVLIISPFIIHHEYNPRLTTSRTNLESLRSCILMYYARTGTYPSDDLSTLVTARFNEGGKEVTYIPEIPYELMSSPRKESAANNPPNRRVYNKLGTEGGWYYDPQTGKVSINYDTTLPDIWGSDLAGENPSRW